MAVRRRANRVWWRGRACREKYREARQVVWDGLTAGKGPDAILEDLVARGADAVGAIRLYVWFRWEWYPWWVRHSSVFGFVQTRPQAAQWVLIWAWLGVVLLGLGLLGLRDPLREFGVHWPYFLLAAATVAARGVWRWRAIRWIDRHGSWHFAGVPAWRLRQLAQEAQAQASPPSPAGRVTPDAEPGAAPDRRA